MDRLRRTPTQVRGLGLIKGLQRLTDIRAIGVSNLDLSFVPAGRLKQMAPYAAASRMEEQKMKQVYAFSALFTAFP